MECDRAEHPYWRWVSFLFPTGIGGHTQRLVAAGVGIELWPEIMGGTGGTGEVSGGFA